MNARQTVQPTLRGSSQPQVKPIAITLSSDLGVAAAANEEHELTNSGAQRVNPLWMITGGLAIFFVFLALVATFD